MFIFLLFFKLGDVLRSLPMLAVKMELLVTDAENEMKPINMSNEQETIPCNTECILNVFIGRNRNYKVQECTRTYIRVNLYHIKWCLFSYFLFLG